ncbi:MAG: hypothetical protein KDE01_32455, partial [Caldilineaceae bacterium]|nr:hypothetical protein [Caldilineaceae bacterium]
MKRLVTALSILMAISMLFAACAAPVAAPAAVPAGEQAAAAPAGEQKTICFAYQDLETEFWVAGHKAIVETLGELGVTVIERNANED